MEAARKKEELVESSCGIIPDKFYLADEKLSGLLVAADLPESHSAGPVPVGLLHSSSGWGGLPGSLGGQLLPGGLPSGGLAGSLLGSCHGWLVTGYQ